MDPDREETPQSCNVHQHVRRQLMRLIALDRGAGSRRAPPDDEPEPRAPDGWLGQRHPAATWRLIDPQYPEILEALPVAVYTTDADGWITFYNEAAAALWGRRPILGRDRWCGCWRIYWPDRTPLPHERCPMAIALRENRPVRNMDAIAERPDGARIPFMPYPTLLRDAANVLIGGVNTLVDLSPFRRRDIPAS